MDSINVLMICNTITKVAYIWAVTVASFHFGKPSILWFYLLVVCLGYSYKTTSKEKGENQDERTTS